MYKLTQKCAKEVVAKWLQKHKTAGLRGREEMKKLHCKTENKIKSYSSTLTNNVPSLHMAIRW